MSLLSLLSRWRAEPSIGSNIVEWRRIPAQPPVFAPFPDELHPALVSGLRKLGYKALFSHQAATWEDACARKNPVLVTGTASGKSLGYNLPVLDRLMWDPQARALYLFPTKALAQDQHKALSELISAAKSDEISMDGSQEINYATTRFRTPEQLPIKTGVYDGDTPSRSRPAVRANARLIITNPDMLHAGILPHHAHWVDFFKNLQFVVIDEMHAYRGVFGSHVANVIRRLKRIAHFYGSNPQFILTSATIANPLELAGKLIEAPVTLIQEDGSARGPRHFLIYNPPVVDRELGIRRSALLESVRLTQDLLHYDVQTIVFGRARRTVELILSYLREGVDDSDSIPSGSKGDLSTPIVRGYRSGYLPKQRREIEGGLREGKVRAVVATNALELGIDIGGMGAAVLTGYPGTIAGTLQQSGRAGRGSEDSLAILVATANPLDQFLAHHPDYFFDRSPEQALINPDNLLILLGHLRCAAFELPFKTGDSFGNVEAARVLEFLQFLQQATEIHHSGDRYFWMAESYPAGGISLRSASAQRVLLLTEKEGGWTTIGEVDTESASWMVHPEAVYLHEAETYLVEELDFEGHTARLRPEALDYYTVPKSETTVELVSLLDQLQTPGGNKSYGELLVTTQVKGFRKVKWYTHEQLAQGDLFLPPTELQTTGYWLSLSDSTIERLRESGLWSNDSNQYGPNWRQQRDRARERDGYTCQVCGVKESGQAHHVHHKIPFRSFSSYEQANQLNNLITLCPGCHHRAETVVKMRSGLSGLAYALGNLAPFFLMCDSRDFGVHSDPQSPLDEGKPVVVLYDLIPAGIGFSQRLYELHDELVLRAYELVSNCECLDGCPSCVGPAGENGTGGKKETLAILENLV